MNINEIFSLNDKHCNSIRSSGCTHNFKPVRDEKSIRSTDDFFSIPVFTWTGSYCCYYCVFHLYLDFSPSRRSVWCLFSLLPLLTLTSKECWVDLLRDSAKRLGSTFCLDLPLFQFILLLHVPRHHHHLCLLHSLISSCKDQRKDLSWKILSVNRIWSCA